MQLSDGPVKKGRGEKQHTFVGLENEFSSITREEERIVLDPEVPSELGSNPSINIFRLTVVPPKFTTYKSIYSSARYIYALK